jgi:hypothetical protein
MMPSSEPEFNDGIAQNRDYDRNPILRRRDTAKRTG